MKTYLRLAMMLLIFSIGASPNPYDGKTGGSYNPVLNTYWCTSTYTCLHEHAHYLDDISGDVSQSQEFIYAINHIDYRWKEYVDNFVNLDYPGYNKYREIYAEMYYWHISQPGMIPIELERFFNLPQMYQKTPKFDKTIRG